MKWEEIKDYEWVDSESWKAYCVAIFVMLIPLIINIILNLPIITIK